MSPTHAYMFLLQDGGAGQLGTVTCPGSYAGYFDVQWDNGYTCDYRMGAEGDYELEIVQ